MWNNDPRVLGNIFTSSYSDSWDNKPWGHKPNKPTHKHINNSICVYVWVYWVYCPKNLNMKMWICCQEPWGGQWQFSQGRVMESHGICPFQWVDFCIYWHMSLLLCVWRVNPYGVSKVICQLNQKALGSNLKAEAAFPMGKYPLIPWPVLECLFCQFLFLYDSVKMWVIIPCA